MIKTIKYFTLYIFLTLITCNVYAEEQVKNKPQEEKKTNAFLRFANEYLFTDYHPIFREQTNMLGIVYTDSFGDHKEDNKKRHLHNIVLQYTRPNHLFGVHGRYTFGFFSLFGNDYVAKQYGGKYKYSMIGFEFIQELIVGNKWLYLSAGIGPSVIVSGHRTTQRPSGKFGFTTLNLASQVAIGHRFDCGLVAEIMIKHYSNGNLGEVNNGQSLYGFALRYVF